MNPDNLDPQTQMGNTPPMATPAPGPAPVAPPAPQPIAQEQPMNQAQVTPPVQMESNMPPEMSPMEQPVAPAMTPPPMMPDEPSGSGGKNKKPLIIVAIVLLLLLAGGAGYTLLSGSSDKDDSGYVNSNSSRDERVIPVEDEEVPETRPGKTETPSTASVKTDTGFTINVTSIVRNFPSDKVDKDEEVILLGIKLETDGTYTGTPSAVDMEVVAADGKKYKKTYAVPEKDVTAGGYVVLPSTSPKVGAPVAGYVAFAVPYKSALTKFIFTRDTTKILGGETLPEKSFETNL